MEKGGEAGASPLADPSLLTPCGRGSVGAGPNMRNRWQRRQSGSRWIAMARALRVVLVWDPRAREAMA